MGGANYTDFALYRRLLWIARPYWPHIAGIFLLSLLSTPLALLTPLPLKVAVDSIIGSQQVPGFLEALLPAVATESVAAVLILAAVLYVVISLLQQLQNLGNWVLGTYTGEKLVLGFRAQLFRHGQRLSLAYHDSKGTADAIYRIQYDAPAIQHIAIDGVVPFVTLIFTLVAMVYVTVRIDWQLALIALAVSPVLFLATQVWRPRLRNRWTDVYYLRSSALSIVQEVLTGIRVVKAFGQEDREQDRFVRHSSNGLRAYLHIVFAEGGFNFLIGMTIAVGTAVALYVGVRHVLAGTLSLGELLIVMSYLAQIYRPLTTIGQRVAKLQSSLASAERAFTLLDELPDAAERRNARPLSRAAGAVAFRNVSFGYEEGHPVLQNISLEVGPGTRLGIAGATGSGKSTLVNLLTRFYEPGRGQILLDGVDIRDYKLADLRNQFAIVLQETVLFSTSIAENIAYACPGADFQDIVAAAKAANAHEFIANLPRGYDALVGERGMRLSGGERQRIALARAFLKDAPILILDEPTSSVDVQTEAGIMEAMERLMGGRTTFMIAHRLSTIENCDVLLVVENGRLVTLTSDVSIVIKNARLLGGRELANVTRSAGSATDGLR